MLENDSLSQPSQRKLSRLALYALNIPLFVCICGFFWALIDAILPPLAFILAKCNLFLICVAVIICTAPLAGFVLGIAAIITIIRHRGTLYGIGRAITGTVLSYLMLGVLFAILFPAISAWFHKDDVRCRQNLQQLRMTVSQLPPEQQLNWCEHVPTYDHDHLVCPKAMHAVKTCTYAINANIVGKKIAEINPETVMLFETQPGWNQVGNSDIIDASRHKGSFNVVFVNGRTRTVKREDVSKLRWMP
jgi:hypothetical protein